MINSNPNNDLTRPGHTHDAGILEFSDHKQLQYSEASRLPVIRERFLSPARIALGMVTTYSISAVAHPAYLAYESLEGNDVYVANGFGAVFAAGAVVAGAVMIKQKFNK
jgi:hypothetical protein